MENGEKWIKKRARTRGRTERILPGMQRGRQEVGEIKHLFKWQPPPPPLSLPLGARPARIPSTSYTHLIYVLLLEFHVRVCKTLAERSRVRFERDTTSARVSAWKNTVTHR